MRTIRPRRPAGAGRLAVLALLWAALPSSAPAEEQSPLDPLLDRIRTGSVDEAAEATNELVGRVVGTLTEALDAISGRPPAEQERLSRMLARTTANLRLRLFRAGLSPADQTLLDDWAARDRELLELLFDDDPDQRLAALYQIPLEPGTVAGVLAAGRVDDWDDTVVEAALEIAARLQDEAVARGLTRYVAQAVAVVQSGRLSPAEQAYVIVLMERVQRCIAILGAAGARDSVATIIDAIRCFSRLPYRRLFSLPDAFSALGQIGDEQAVPLLLEYLEDRELRAVHNIDVETAVYLTVGDVALLALAQIYGLPPEVLGFRVGLTPKAVTGFVDQRARETARQTFRAWHAENGSKPPDQRRPLVAPPRGGPGETHEP